MTTNTHSHRTSQVAILERPETHDPKCDTCGRSMAEIRAERNAAARPARTKRVDARTPVQRDCDNERRRARRARTGR